MGRMYDESNQSGSKESVMAFFTVDLTLAIPNVVSTISKYCTCICDMPGDCFIRSILTTIDLYL